MIIPVILLSIPFEMFPAAGLCSAQHPAEGCRCQNVRFFSLRFSLWFRCRDEQMSNGAPTSDDDDGYDGDGDDEEKDDDEDPNVDGFFAK